MYLFSLYMVIFFWDIMLKLILNLLSGNSKVMKLQWYGRCSCTSTSCTRRIGTTTVQCLLSYFSMALYSRLPTHWFVSALASRCIMWFYVCCAFPGCTSIIYTHKIFMLKGLQSFMRLPYSLVVFAGCVIVVSAMRYLVGPSTHKVMPCGMSSWVLILTLQTPF